MSAETIPESMFSVCYRTGAPTIEDYDEAIQELERAKVDLRWKRERFALPHCFVCEDTGHTAEHCHHNPLLLAREWARATNVWQCWHCGFVATNADEAEEHFGKSEDEVAKCLRGWQPIETAPKDGTKILLQGGVYHGYPFVGFWDPSPYAPDRPWMTVVGRSSLYEHVPKHWMHLPADPKEGC